MMDMEIQTNYVAYQRLKRLLVVILLMIVVVIALGAYTRLADAGLGCPDWPGCYGQLLVPSGADAVQKANLAFPERAVEPYKAWLEMVHRYFAGTLGMLVFALTWLCFKTTGAPRGLPVAISLLIVGQALLGMWTVTLKLMPVVVMAHLLGGFTLFVLLALLYVRLSQLSQLNGARKTVKVNESTKPTSSRLPPRLMPNVRWLRFGVLAWLVLLAQIMLGGWTSANYAALMCTSLPICEGDWSSYLDWQTAFSFWQAGHENYEFGVLEYPARMTIHVAHRIGAMLTALILGSYALLLALKGVGRIRQVGVGIGCLLLVQIGLGIGNVLLQLPIFIAVAHNMVGAWLLVITSVSLYLLWQARLQSDLSNDKEVSNEQYQCVDKH